MFLNEANLKIVILRRACTLEHIHLHFCNTHNDINTLARSRRADEYRGLLMSGQQAH